MREEITDPPLMPLGKFRGQPIGKMTTPYLLWLLSQDAIRQRYRHLMRNMLAELRGRFLDFNTLVEELTPKAPTPEYWKLTPNHSAIRKQRAKDRQRRNQPRPLPTKEPPGVILDASYWTRKARQQAMLNTYVDDLL